MPRTYGEIFVMRYDGSHVDMGHPVFVRIDASQNRSRSFASLTP